MNERIKQLAEQAEETYTWKEFGPDGYSHITKTKQNVNLEKFAELIVAECAKVILETPVKYTEIDIMHQIRDNVKEHFGVTV